jgi:hypothetical protein
MKDMTKGRKREKGNTMKDVTEGRKREEGRQST